MYAKLRRTANKILGNYKIQRALVNMSNIKSVVWNLVDVWTTSHLTKAYSRIEVQKTSAVEDSFHALIMIHNSINTAGITYHKLVSLDAKYFQRLQRNEDTITTKQCTDNG